ncbi:chaplin [Streptomyces sp. NPDC048506]|uniref:chaplin n=1 Tax=Streptomyces sp. NPDC048506 TaxID=3155028 RepID=UPI003446AC53
MNTVKKAAFVLSVTGLALGAAAGAAFATDGAQAGGQAVCSPGIASGNNTQAPVHIPVNITGNSVDAVSLLSPNFANSSINN